jgi:colanic acid/amylovoran biosynthesis glycosyltransferase
MSAHIGYVLKKFPRLSETFVLGEILAQEALGTEVTVFSRRPADHEPRHPELAALRAPVVDLPHPREADPFGLLLESGDAPAELARLGAVIAQWRPRGAPRFSGLLTEALTLREECRRRHVGHLHAHFASDSALVAHLVAALGGPGYSLTAHAKDIYRETVDPHLLEQLVGASAFTVTVCDANVEYLAGKLSPTALQRVRRHYNGIDRAAFEGLARRPVPGRVLSIGRLVEKKGFDVLLAALERLVLRGMPVDAEIIGDGELRAELERHTAAGPAAGRVRFLGALPADQVRQRLAEAAVFALPCKTGNDGNRDALPTVLLEAQAAGVPIVSTPVAGVVEILDHGRCGSLVREGDPQATAAAIERLLIDPHFAAGLADRGREWGAVHFDRERQARVLGEWFHAALAESPVRNAQPEPAPCVWPT